MKKMKFFVSSIFILLLGFISCENDLDLPGEGSVADLTPPVANFAFSGGDQIDNFLEFQFSNFSTGATGFDWDFGDGTTSEDFEPGHTFPDEGSYTVTLVISDDLGVTSTLSSEVIVIQPEVSNAITPVINSPGFEQDLSLPCTELGNDGKSCWNEGPGDTIQITGSANNIRTGEKGAKFDMNSQDRVAYQDLIAVTPNTDYIFQYWYIIEEEQLATGPSMITAWIIPEGTYSDIDTLIAANIAVSPGTTQNTTYTPATITFNSGANNTIGIAFSSDGNDEVYADDFSLTPLE